MLALPQRNHRSSVSMQAYAQYEAIVKKRLIPWAGACDIKAITPMQIDEFYATLLQQGRADGKGGLSAKSVLYIHRVLNGALGHAVQKGLLVKNPLLSVTNIPKAKSSRHPHTARRRFVLCWRQQLLKTVFGKRQSHSLQYEVCGAVNALVSNGRKLTSTANPLPLMSR